nr:hypothetical protein [Tanacetum cinerariifolium]
SKNSPLSSSSSSDHVSEPVAIEEYSRTTTPLFLPSSYASEWGSDTKWDLFVMSPRKDIYKIDKSPPKTSPDTLRLRVLNGNMNIEKGCSRRLEFSNGSKSTKVTSERSEIEGVTKNLVGRKNLVLEDLLLVDKLNADGPIEDVLGLGEFDGHEGVDTEFNKDRRLEFSNGSKSTKVTSERSEIEGVAKNLVGRKNLVLEDLLLVDKLNADGPIEDVLGLGEFDGHEGVDTEFNKDSSDHVSEPVAIEEYSRTTTPLFLPSSYASEWGSDTKWDLFVMSPRKDIYKIDKSPPKTSPDTLRLRVLNGNMNIEKGCSRRLEFSNGSKSTKVTSERSEIEGVAKNLVGRKNLVLEDLLLVDKLNADGPIEDVLGLGEFDGHEGVDTEFNKDRFSLVEIV